MKCTWVVGISVLHLIIQWSNGSSQVTQTATQTALNGSKYINRLSAAVSQVSKTKLIKIHIIKYLTEVNKLYDLQNSQSLD